MLTQPGATDSLNENISKKFNNTRMLAVFAHPDDEVFCAGGTLAQYAANGADIMVVSATQGEAGQIRDANIATRRTLGQVRAQELYRACEQLGVQHVQCLDYGDGALQNVNRQALTAEITRIIRSFKPDIIITFGPDGAYGHPDHIVISDITTQAFHRAGNAKQYPEQLVDGLLPHQSGRLYYSYFPRSQKLLLDRLVRWLVKLDQRFKGSVDFAHALLIFSEESMLLGYSSDHFEVAWFPTGYYVVEQGEPATKLYLMLSGQAAIIQEDDDGTLHTLAHVGVGDFFGEEGLAYQQPRNAHVTVTKDATCLVFSPEAPSNYAGRGPRAHLTNSTPASSEVPLAIDKATTCIDVSNFVQQKMAAMAAHRTQFSIQSDMFPYEMLSDLFGNEYFVRVFPPPKLENTLL